MCAYYITIAPFFLAHNDLGWHLMAGDLIRSTGAIPEHDPWSFTAGNERWYNLSWLWDVSASLLFAYGHFTALILATIGLGCLIAAILAFICLSQQASIMATIIAVVLACILYPLYAAPDIFLAAAPQVITLVFCVIFYALCLNRRALWLMPLCMVLWANLHGGFILGFLILGIFGIVALCRKEFAFFNRLSFCAVACLLATLINPLGIHIYVGLLGTLGHFTQRYISEWQPYFAMIRYPQGIPCVIYMACFVGLEVASLLSTYSVVLRLDRRIHPSSPLRHGSCAFAQDDDREDESNATPAPKKGGIEARLLAWLFLLLGLWQLRYLSLFFLFSTVPMALHFTLLLGRHSRAGGNLSGNTRRERDSRLRGNDKDKEREEKKENKILFLISFILFCTLPSLYATITPKTLSFLPQIYPEQEITYLQQHYPHPRLLNHWNYGSFIIYQTNGTLPVFIDGRSATAYPDALLYDYFPLLNFTINEPAWNRVLTKYRINAVLWPTSDASLAQFFIGKPGWKRVYSGQIATLYVKENDD